MASANREPHGIAMSGKWPHSRLRACVIALSMAGAITAAGMRTCLAQVINVGGGAGASSASGSGGSGGGNNGGGAGGSVGSSAGAAGTLMQGGNGAGALSCDTQPFGAGCGGATQAVNNPQITGNVNGNDGVAGTAGIAGGGGGAGAVITSGNMFVGPAGATTLRGGAGGASASAGAGGGGAGLIFIGNQLVDDGAYIYGGAGGTGTSSNAGGGGGVGLYFQGNALMFNAEGTYKIIGGLGGQSGGSGGTGVIVSANGATITNISNSSGTGFNGGNGAAGSGGIADGSGGDGIDIYGSGNTYLNRGFTNPGASAGHAPLAIGVHVHGNDNTIVNASGGDIEGGWSLLDSSQTAPGGIAIRFDGNSNILELQAGYVIDGKVIAAGGGNTLALGGSANGTFDLSKVVSSLDNTNNVEQYQGFAMIEKTGLGTWTVTGSVGDSHPWAVEQGTLALGANGNLAPASNVNVDATLDVSGVTAGSTSIQSLSGAATGTVTLGGKTLVISNAQGGSTPIDPGNFAGNIGGAGSVEITGGTQVFSGINTYQGNTVLEGGTLSVSADANLGTGVLELNGGTLANTADFGSSRDVVLDNNGGTFETDGNLSLSGTLSGNGGLTKTGSGTLTLTGAATYSGATSISAGTLEIGNGLNNTFTSAVTDNGTLEFNDNDAFSYAGTLSGTGAIAQTGAGAVTLSGNSSGFAGTTTVNAGTLAVDGTLGGTMTVAGGVLKGTGTINGNTTIGTAALAGRQGDVLSFGGNLTLSSNSSVDVSLGVPDASAGLFNVAGNLTLAGTLNVTDLGGFGPGLYRLFDYSGGLTNNGLAIGSTPAGISSSDLSVQTSITHEVNLVNTGGASVNFWDGGTASNHNNGAVDGGNGIWNAANDNWTTANGSVNSNWNNGQFAVFAGQAGTVTIDDSAGAISVDGMQFATDGYRVEGDAIALANPNTIIRVGTGGGAIAAGITATIASALTGSGGLEKTDNGTLVLSGNNSYTGGTFINGGTLSVSSDANLGAAAGGIAIDGGALENTSAFSSTRNVTLGAGSGQFKTDVDLTLTGTIGGAGGLVKTGGGTLTLTANNTYSGATQISQGTLQLGNGGNTGSIAGNIDDDGQLIFDRSDVFTLTGAIGGTGSVTQAGTGTVVLTGSNNYRGGTTIASGTLQLGSGGTSGAIAGNVVDNGTLAFDRSDTIVYGGKISGAGNVKQIGPGTTDLTGDSSAFSGTTTVSNGTLSIDGSLGGTVTVGAGGTLAGIGSVGATTIASGGTIAPGHSPGTLHVNGDIAFDAGSTYRADIVPNQSGDLIAASGKAVINGGTVSAAKAGGVYTPGSQWTIVSAGRGVSGRFDALTQNMPFVNLSLAYDANAVYLNATRNGTSFCSAAQTRNECATGNGAESLGQGNAVYDALASAADEASARQALDALSGEVYASQKAAMVDDSRIPRDAAIARMRAAFDDNANPGPALLVSAENGNAGSLALTAPARVAFWAQGFGGWNQWNGDGNAATFDRSLGGLLVGADMPVMNTWRVGLMAGAGNSRFDVDARRSSGSIVDGHLALYGGSQWGPLGLRLGIGYTWHDIDTHRSVAFPGLSENLSAHYGAATLQGFGEVGYRFDSHVLTLEPFLDVASINLHTSGFTETGGAAALTSAGGNTNVTFTTIGIRGEKAYSLYGWKTTMRGSVGWRHAFGDTTPLSVFNFTGGNPFTIAGVPIARDAASIDAGLDVALTKAATFGISYTGQYARHAQDYGVQATLTVAF